VEKNGRLRTPRGPRENRSRPAVDPLFRSAALAFGSRVIGVVLSGGLDDGTAGLRGIKMCGGTTIAQDPSDAVVNSMPLNAIRNATVDYSQPAREIGTLIAHLVAEPAPKSAVRLEDNMRRQLETEVSVASDPARSEAILAYGVPSPFTCPECHGSLLRLRGERPMRFRCHTGHAFTADSLMAELNATTEQAIWNAVRVVQESAILHRHLADHWEATDPAAAAEHRQKAQAALRKADVIRTATSERPTHEDAAHAAAADPVSAEV
jgi:two-component system, chemotaxis family, protein-glutamate methylesterase/glutaminase